MAALVLDKRKKPLMPCSEKRARLLLERGRARVHRMVPFTIRLVDRLQADSVLQPLRLKLDPGGKTTGVALVREKETVEASTGEVLRAITILMLLELKHRGHAIRDAIASRGAFRRRRRGKLRYRPARFNNRTKPEGWLPPSLQHRVDTTMTWVARLCRWSPVTALSQELVRFDLEGLKADEAGFTPEAPEQATQELALSAGQIPALVRAFRAAWEARKESVIAAHRAHRYTRFFQEEMNKALGKNCYEALGDLHQDLQKPYADLRRMAWMSVLHTPEFQEHLTRKAQGEIRSKFEVIEKMEFSVSNIYGFLQGLALQQGAINTQMVCDLFDQITYANSENCLFYRWKSNERHRVGMALQRKRFILSGFSLEGWKTYLGYSEKRELDEIDKIFALVDGKREAEVSLSALFDEHMEELRDGARLESTYFEIRFYPGIGTIHFYPKNQKLIDRINTIVGKHRSWMPESFTPEEEPNYKAAEKMTKQVIRKMSRYALRDAFGGRYQEASEIELNKAFDQAVAEGGVPNFWTAQIGDGNARAKPLEELTAPIQKLGLGLGEPCVS